MTSNAPRVSSFFIICGQLRKRASFYPAEIPDVRESAYRIAVLVATTYPNISGLQLFDVQIGRHRVIGRHHAGAPHAPPCLQLAGDRERKPGRALHRAEARALVEVIEQIEDDALALAGAVADGFDAQRDEVLGARMLQARLGAGNEDIARHDVLTPDVHAIEIEQAEI